MNSSTKSSSLGQQLAEYLKNYRHMAHISLGEASAYLGYSDQQIILQYENGELGVPLKDIYALANLYNIPPDELLAKFFALLEEMNMQNSEEKCSNEF